MGAESIGRSAFGAIYDANAEIVYKTALHDTGDHHAAEELTQNVFLKLYTCMDHINLDAVRAWLLVSVKNMAKNYKRNRYWEIPTDEMYEEGYDAIMTESLETEFEERLKVREYRELADSIFDALYMRNRSWFDAVMMTYCLQKPQREVAELMGISLDTLHSMLYRAKQWIRRNYKSQFDHVDKA